MSATNHTTNYELPIFVGSDKPAWLVDWNGAMTAIDTAIHTAEGKADQAGTDIGGIESSITTINSTLTSINNAVSQLRIDTNANTGNINTINSLIGNGEPTTTDKTLIGAINEIYAELTDFEEDVKPEVIATISGDGTKTYGQALAEVYQQLPSGLSGMALYEELSRYELIHKNTAGTHFAVCRFAGTDEDAGTYSFTATLHRSANHAFNMYDFKIGSTSSSCDFLNSDLLTTGTVVTQYGSLVMNASEQFVLYKLP